MKVLLLLSGPTAVGKTVISSTLSEHHGFFRIATSPFLRAIAETHSQSAPKAVLQELGDELDIQTNFAWVVDLVAKPSFEQSPGVARWLVDSIRKKQQVAAFRDGFGARVLHVHLTEPDSVLKERYELRVRDDGVAVTPYDDVIVHGNEVSARSLVDIADLTFDVTRAANERIVRTILDECLKREV